MSTVKLNYEIFGQGSPVMILHGLFGSARNWQGIAKQFTDRHTLVAVDLRNHGKSEHAASMTYEEMARDLATLIQEESLQELTLIGHSMGGKVAMMLALHYPELLEKIIVMDIAPVNYDNAFGDYIDVMLDLPVTDLSNRNEANESLAAKIPEAGIRTFLLQNLVKVDIGYAWRINLQTIKSNLSHISGFPNFTPGTQYHGLSLFLGGEHSDYIQPQHHDPIQSLFPSSIIDSIAEAGHWLHADQPQAVTARIDRFLTEEK